MSRNRRGLTMPINAHPEYIEAEREYQAAESLEDKLKSLEKMISYAPKHKGGENLRAQLRARYKSLKERIEKVKKSGKSSGVGIKKMDMQAVIVGFKGTGKSSLLKSLTNAHPRISSEFENKVATKSPEVGIINYLSGIQVQLIEIPAIKSDYYDKGLVHTADSILILVDNLEQIKEIEKNIEKFAGKKIIVVNKVDLLAENEKRKLIANLKSKKYNFEVISTETGEGLNDLKERLFKSFNKLRIYTKEPGKEKTNKAMIMREGSKVGDVAEKILKGFSKRVKETRIWGPSSKFPGQIVGLKHVLKDLDVVEFKTR